MRATPQTYRVVLAIALLCTACSQEPGRFQLELVFPDVESRDAVNSVQVWAIDPGQSSCAALVGGRDSPNQVTVHTSVALVLPADAPPQLKQVPPGKVLFFAEAQPAQDDQLLRGCTAATVEPSEDTLVVIALGWVCRDASSCSDGGFVDGGAADAAAGDTSALDAGAVDRVAPERPQADIASPDHAAPDHATVDSAAADIGDRDAARSDAARPDASAPDAARSDAVPRDAATLDTAMPDAAMPDIGVPDTARIDAAGTPAENYDWFVAPYGGGADQNGSINEPWSLEYAGSGADGRIQAGDDVAMRGGAYVGSYTISCTGSGSLPITFRAYSLELPVIAQPQLPPTASPPPPALRMRGAHLWVWGVEVRSDAVDRFAEGDISEDPSAALVPMGACVDIDVCDSCKLINSYLHDCRHGLIDRDSASGTEVFGNFIYNVGWSRDGAGPGGYGLRIANPGGTTKSYRFNVVFNAGSQLLAVEASDNRVEDLILYWNVFFHGFARIGGSDAAASIDGIWIEDNFSYDAELDLGWLESSNGQVTVQGSTLVASADFPLSPVRLLRFENLSFRNNSVVAGTAELLVFEKSPASSYPYGTWGSNIYYSGLSQPFVFDASAADWTTYEANTLDPSSILLQQRPTNNWYAYQGNTYDLDRMLIVASNFELDEGATLGLAGFLEAGRYYEVFNAYDVLGPPIISGVYAGELIQPFLLPTSPAQPAGTVLAAAPSPAPEHGVFLIVRGPE